jgi:hypothetical protein
MATTTALTTATLHRWRYRELLASVPGVVYPGAIVSKQRVRYEPAPCQQCPDLINLTPNVVGLHLAVLGKLALVTGEFVMCPRCIVVVLQLRDNQTCVQGADTHARNRSNQTRRQQHNCSDTTHRCAQTGHKIVFPSTANIYILIRLAAKVASRSTTHTASTACTTTSSIGLQ